MASVDPTEISTRCGEPPEKWPGWPGQNAFRLVVPASAVGSIIGRRGQIIKRISERTGARIHVIALPAGTTDCVVLISAKEQPHLHLSPAMDAVMEVFKCATGLSPVDATGMCPKAPEAKPSSVTFLVGSSQALAVIGKEGARVRAIQESSGTSVAILSPGCAGVPFYVSQDERMITIEGQVLKVMVAMEAVLHHLRLYLVDSSVIPAFSEKYKAGISLAGQSLLLHRSTPTNQPRAGSRYSVSLMGHEAKAEAEIPTSHSSLYPQEPVLSSGLPLVRSCHAALPAQKRQRIQIPFSAAKGIIGVAGETIDHIRRTSGSIITIEEDRTLSGQYILEVRGTTSQLQTAQQLIEELLESHHQTGSIYDNMDAGLSSNSQFALTTHPLSPFSTQYCFPSGRPSGENGTSRTGEDTGLRIWEVNQVQNNSFH